MRRHHDDGQSRPRIANLLQQIQARLPGHANVRDQYIRRLTAQSVERWLRRLERTWRHAAVAKRALQNPSYGGIVIDEPDPQRRRDAHVASPNGNSKVKTVRPGSLSNSMSPPWRVTRSCATASPRPVPVARPVTSG